MKLQRAATLRPRIEALLAGDLPRNLLEAEHAALAGITEARRARKRKEHERMIMTLVTTIELAAWVLERTREQERKDRMQKIIDTALAISAGRSQIK